MKTDKNKTYLLDISYLGKNFNGFQSQLDGSGIQDHIEKALSIFLREKTKIIGSSRTDSGVHAFGQKASFRTEKSFETKRLLLGVNSLLSNDIGLRSLHEVPKEFHPILNAKAKLYRYTLWKGRCFNPFMRPFAWSVPGNLDLEVLRKGLEEVCGQHDFTSFCNTDTNAKTRVRNLLETQVVDFEDSVDLWFLGEGFLKQMIRILVGSLVDLSFSKNSHLSMTEILKEKSREAAGQTAPAEGLALVEVFFEKPPSLPKLISQYQKHSFLFR